MPWSGVAPNQTFSRTNGAHNGTTVWQQDEAIGTGIEADLHDTHDQDIATALNLSLKKDGGNKPTADIPWGGFKITGLGAATADGEAVRYEQVYKGPSKTAEITVASATTCDILGAASELIAISGTTTITSFGTGTNKVRWVRATGAFLITHHATSLICPGGADITTAAGDTFVVVSDGSSNARIVAYQRGSIQPVPALGRGNVLCPHENLVVKFVSAATVDIDADAVVLFDTDGVPKRFASLNETLNIASSGANGLDTGAEGSSTWYHIWAIGKADGTLDGLFSASSSAPTLPSGYTFKGYLGAAYNNASSNFTGFVQRGSQVSCVSSQPVSAGTQTSYAAVSLTNIIPPTAVRVTGYGGIYTSTGTTAEFMYIAPAGSGTTATYGDVFINKAAAISANSQILGWFDFPLSTAQEIKYYVGGTNPRANIYINGWSF